MLCQIRLNVDSVRPHMFFVRVCTSRATFVNICNTQLPHCRMDGKYMPEFCAKLGQTSTMYAHTCFLFVCAQAGQYLSTFALPNFRIVAWIISICSNFVPNYVKRRQCTATHVSCSCVHKPGNICRHLHYPTSALSHGW